MLVNRAADADRLQARVTELETEKLAGQVETDLTEFEGVIANRDEVKVQLLANREGTLKVLKGLKKPEVKPETKPDSALLPNRRQGTLPTGLSADGAESAKAEQRAAAIRNRAAEIQKTVRGLTFTAAFARAEAEVA